jgi:hypothetical protein
MNTQEKITIMQAFVDGKIVECKDRGSEFSEWVVIKNTNPFWDWKELEYRIKPSPEYVPFDFSDAKRLISEIIKHKEIGSLSVITNVNPKNITSSGTVIRYDTLLEKYEFLDGSACGKIL